VKEDLMKRKAINLILLSIVSLFIIFFIIGCTDASVIPEPKGYINDFAGMISKESTKSLEDQLSEYEKQTTNEIAVVTVKTIGGKTIEDYSIALAEKWKVGKENKDNGVILLIAKEEKKIRIEVGYGLEATLTDGEAKQIIDQEISPRFKSDDFAGGIQAGVNSIIAAIDGTYVPGQSSPVNSEGLASWAIILLVFGGLIVLIFIIMFIAGVVTGEGGSWSSGGGSGGGGGGGGFGGGSFGGGGASGGW
jgi:uncharacterized protein